MRSGQVAAGEGFSYWLLKFDGVTGNRDTEREDPAGYGRIEYAYSYEQALQTMRQLDLPMAQIKEQYRRMAFNIVARNQDDHVKNIAFLMDKTGQWSLSPAFDMTYSYNPAGRWTRSHQMTLNGKRDDFQLEDFVACEKGASMKRGRGLEILQEVHLAVLQWPKFASAADVPTETARMIARAHRIEFAS